MLLCLPVVILSSNFITSSAVICNQNCTVHLCTEEVPFSAPTLAFKGWSPLNYSHAMLICLSVPQISEQKLILLI